MIVHARDGSLLVRDDESGELVFAIVQGENANAELLWRRIPRGKCIANWVADNRQAAIVNDTVNDGRFYGGLDEECAFSTRSILAARILAGDEMLGVIEVLNKRSAVSFNERDKERLARCVRWPGESWQP